MGVRINFSEIDVKNIIKKYSIDKISCRKIGNLYGVSEHIIRRLLKENSISMNDTSKYKKYSVNEYFLDEINDVSSFFIGLMASDGNITNKKNSKCRTNIFSISQSGDNGLDLIEQVKRWLSYSGKIYHIKTTHKVAHQISISSIKLIKKLLEHNIKPNKSFTYSYNGKAILKPFLQGYIEGDGCVGVYNNGKNNTYFYISFFGNEEFKKSIIDLLPIEPNCREVNDGYYEIKFLGNKGIKFCDWLWETPVYKESKKYKKYLHFKNTVLKNARYYKFHILNSEINKMLSDGTSPKEISEVLEIKRRTIYNLTYNNKNGRNTY